MSDRKYRQRGYQDEGSGPRRSEGPRKPPEPRDPRLPRDPKAPNMPGYQQVFRCARCGRIEPGEIGSMSLCSQCGVALHACIQCSAFDPGARFECTQAITVRVSPKDTRNECQFFSGRVQVERQTGSTAPNSARKAFDDLFNL